MDTPPREILDYVVAELRVGARAPDDVLSHLRETWAWDETTANRLQADILAAQDDGRLTDAEAASLSLGLATWRVTTTDDDEPTETIGERAHAAAVMWPSHESQDEPSLELHPGVTLHDRYVLGEAIARGGQSIVFRAYILRDDETAAAGSPVAIKVLRDAHPSDSAIARLRREYRQSLALGHPGVPQMFDLDCDRGTWFIAMELLDGVSLRTRLNRMATQPLGTAEALRIVAECATVLTHAHRHGIVHGDLKPANVFLQEGGGVKVLDFGSAYDIQPAPPRAARGIESFSSAATRTYASPEVLDGLPAEPRDDIFSLACAAYEMLAGRHPFGRVPANDARRRALEANPVAGLSLRQNAALADGLAWSRSGRPSTVEQWMRSLLGGTHEDAARDTTWPSRVSAPAPWFPWRWVGAVGVGVALLLLVMWWTSRPSQDRGPGPSVAAAPPFEPAVDDGLRPPLPSDSATESSRTLESTVMAPNDATAPSPITAAGTSSTQRETASPTSAATANRAHIQADGTAIRISEGAPAAVVVLRRSGGNMARPVTVTWQLQDGSAHSGEDFTAPATRSTRFAGGQTTRAIYVPLVNDDVPETEESFSLALQSSTATVDGSSSVQITILDDD